MQQGPTDQVGAVDYKNSLDDRGFNSGLAKLGQSLPSRGVPKLTANMQVKFGRVDGIGFEGGLKYQNNLRQISANYEKGRGKYSGRMWGGGATSTESTYLCYGILCLTGILQGILPVAWHIRDHRASKT